MGDHGYKSVEDALAASREAVGEPSVKVMSVPNATLVGWHPNYVDMRMSGDSNRRDVMVDCDVTLMRDDGVIIEVNGHPFADLEGLTMKHRVRIDIDWRREEGAGK